MAEMTLEEFEQYTNCAIADSQAHSENYMPLNRQELEYYLQCDNGFEVEGQSQVHSSEVSDVVESDMPALVRFFLSGGEIIKFIPNTQNPIDVQEAHEKTKYVHHIIQAQKNSFRILHDWLKTIEINSIGTLHYTWEEAKTVERREYSGLDEDELALILSDLEEEKQTRNDFDYEATESDNGGQKDVEIKITRTKKGVVIKNIPIEQLRISSNAETKDGADFVGHEFMARRGDLKAQGYLKSLSGVSIDDIAATFTAQDSGMRSVRFKQQGGNYDHTVITDKASEYLVVVNGYVLLDYDGDGIPERRHIIKIGTEYFHNEQFDHVPYAFASAILMPSNIMGRSRAEITLQSQLLGTEIMRSTMDNIYDVSAGRVAVNADNIDMNSLLTDRNNSVIMFDGSPDIRKDIMQVETPFVGDKTLLIMQYLDSKRVSTTGENLANQGLQADKIYNETATRFEGIRDAGAAKIELVARCIAETGMRELFEGVAWLVSRFQSTRDEITVLGKQLTINPTRWWNDHNTVSRIGLGAGDDEEAIANFSGILQIQNQLKAEGSSLVDDKDRYNTISRMMQAMGEFSINEFFNDPEAPEQSAQFLMEQNQQLMQMIQQLQGQLQNPLAEAEMVKREGDVAIAQGKLQLEAAKLAEQQRQFNEKMSSDRVKQLLDLERDYTKIEADNQIDVPGKGM